MADDDRGRGSGNWLAFPFPFQRQPLPGIKRIASFKLFTLIEDSANAMPKSQPKIPLRKSVITGLAFKGRLSRHWCNCLSPTRWICCISHLPSCLTASDIPASNRVIAAPRASNQDKIKKITKEEEDKAGYFDAAPLI